MVTNEAAYNTLAPLFPSVAKSYTSADLVKIMAYIDFFNAKSEGVGGTKGYPYGQPGTGLRAPGMPFYEHPYSIRRSMLLCLAKQGYITLKVVPGVKANEFEITPAGTEVAKKIYAAGFFWYSYVAGSSMDSMRNYGVGLLTEEEEANYAKANAHTLSYHRVYTKAVKELPACKHSVLVKNSTLSEGCLECEACGTVVYTQTQKGASHSSEVA